MRCLDIVAIANNGFLIVKTGTMINWFEKDKRTVITDTDRPFWFKRVNSLDEAKAYIDECRDKRSMSAFNERYYAAYSMEGDWVVVDKTGDL